MAIDIEELLKILPDLIKSNPKIKDAISDVLDSLVPRTTMSLRLPGDLPRLGRRESEPHSMNVSFIHDVLTENFPEDRTFWDLHHYFQIDDSELDIQFDVSYFRNFPDQKTYSSYKASEHNNRIPDFTVNVLSTRTWSRDLSDIPARCEMVKIPYYVVFAPYKVATQPFHPPFLRAYIWEETAYIYKDCRVIAKIEGNEEINPEGLMTLTNLPFRFGLEQCLRLHSDNQKLYRLIFVHLEDQVLFQTSEANEKQRADEEKQRADEEKQRADRYLDYMRSQGLDIPPD